MNSELLYQFVEMIEAEARARPSRMEFEMAYQARIAIDRIKLAVKHAEQPDQSREVGLLLLDALDRLQSVERRFQLRSRRTAQAHRRVQNRPLGNLTPTAMAGLVQPTHLSPRVRFNRVALTRRGERWLHRLRASCPLL